MTTLVALCLLSLLTGLDTTVAGIVVRPFDFLVGLLLVVALMDDAPRESTRRPLVITAGLFTLLPFFYIHVASALSLGTENALRELLQIVIILSFAVAISTSIYRLDASWFSRCMLLGMTCIMIVNIGLHISQGIWSGWKRFDDPKMAFTFLPVAIAITMFIRGSTIGLWSCLFWFLLGSVVIVSGERKAMLTFAFISLLLMICRIGRPYMLLCLVAAVPAVIFFHNMADSYTVRQVSSMFSPIEAAEYDFDEHGQLVPRSFSNVQRAFAAEQSKRYFLAHPMFGIGTNGYLTRVREEFGTMPNYLLISIHGEFQRVVVENGLTGLATYLLVWMISFWRSTAMIKVYLAPKDSERMHWLLASMVFYVSAISQCGLEASGSRVFVLLVLVAVYPDVLSYHFRKKALDLAGRAARGRRPCLNAVAAE